jgi:hypothetical protein
MGTLSYSYGKPYGYRGKEFTCQWCGDALHAERRGGGPGYRGNGWFCSIRCGYQWAVQRQA